MKFKVQNIRGLLRDPISTSQRHYATFSDINVQIKPPVLQGIMFTQIIETVNIFFLSRFF